MGNYSCVNQNLVEHADSYQKNSSQVHSHHKRKKSKHQYKKQRSKTQNQRQKSEIVLEKHDIQKISSPRPKSNSKC